ncbi:MAG: hypothetical protein AAF517_05970, partial [Planctomycetota bacterium]
MTDLKQLGLSLSLALAFFTAIGASPWARDDRLAPYPAIRWEKDAPEVQVDGQWYALLAIDDLETAKIVSFCKSTYGGIWQKRFDEDLVEVLKKMGKTPGREVDLKLRHLESGREEWKRDVAMTHENRSKIWKARNSRPTSSRGYPVLAPYSEIRWKGETAEVALDGEWYKLLAIDSLSVRKIVKFCEDEFKTRWQKRFDEDLVEVLTRMGQKPGKTVDLKLRDLESGKKVWKRGVAMTHENRQAIYAKRHARQTPRRGYALQAPYAKIRWKDKTPEIEHT